MLALVADLSYPAWLTNAAPFLPEIDLECVATSGTNFLSEAVTNSSPASVSGFLNAITTGCTGDDYSLSLSGGYDNEAEELGMNMAVEISARSNV
jgi:hypothetical protein